MSEKVDIEVLKDRLESALRCRPVNGDLLNRSYGAVLELSLLRDREDKFLDDANLKKGVILSLRGDIERLKEENKTNLINWEVVNKGHYEESERLREELSKLSKQGRKGRWGF